MSEQRQRTERLQTHVEAALTKLSTVLPSFAEIARRLRIITPMMKSLWPPLG
jgi:hypothetical protein